MEIRSVFLERYGEIIYLLAAPESKCSTPMLDSTFFKFKNSYCILYSSYIRIYRISLCMGKYGRQRSGNPNLYINPIYMYM